MVPWSHGPEFVPWLVGAACFFVFPDYLHLGAQVLIMVLFALSLDLILGYAGIVSLGHAALFGTGAYTAGILSAHLGWHEPITGLLAAGLAAGIVGFLSGAVILRTRGLTLLMLTMAVTILLQEFANEQAAWTGGDDGLYGISTAPLFGRFDFDLFGKTAYVYCLAVLFVALLAARTITRSSFGQTLTGIRENERRMFAIGSNVHAHALRIYTISAVMAGIAGGLLTQTTEFVALDVLSFERSGDVLIMLILGGSGRLYGAFVGAPLYMILQDQLAKLSPEYWLFGIGMALILTVLYAPQGLLGLAGRWSRRFGGGPG